MSFLKEWPKCSHDEIAWAGIQQCLPGTGAAYEYQPGQCMECGRPVVLFWHVGIPDSEVVATRRHVAWWVLGKEWEHAGNVVVLDAREDA